MSLEIQSKNNKKKIKVSDLIAKFLKDKKIKHVFGIIGSANSHIFDSINKLKYTEIINVHHEQAATMAMQSYYRVNGRPCACILTAGAGSSNAITGVISAWADSIPGLIISGQEKSTAIKTYRGMRMWGVQGFDSTLMVKKVTKFSKRVTNSKDIVFYLNTAYDISIDKRPGPVWIDVPLDIQGSSCNLSELKKYKFNKKKKINLNQSLLNNIEKLIKKSKRPVFWFGNGIKLSKSENLMPKLLKKFPIPFFLSWSAVDLLPSNHKLNFGRPGVYGNRASNLILQSSDLIISIGTRMSIPMIGYVHNEFARDAKIICVDIDKKEINKLKKKINIKINLDAGTFINNLNKKITIKKEYFKSISKCISFCQNTLKNFPHLEKLAHKDEHGFINSYNFLEKFSSELKKNDCVVTDMGTALLSGHQIMKFNGKQKMITSQGLGEMGFGLPGAIGASIAKNKSEVICLNCDGGIMMNLQELQTINQYNLPIKLFVFNNDGYLMIKHTQKNFFGGRYTSVNKKTGISFPNFKILAKAFNFDYFKIKTWADYTVFMKKNFRKKKSFLCDVFMDPEQNFHPKLSTFIDTSNNIVSPPLEDLSPFLERNKLENNLLVKLHKKSKLIK
jgi:acetolactate synthase-1/2/3 large subunit